MFHSITLEAFAFAHSKACLHKALGPDGIPMYILKLLGRPLLEYLQPMFQACFHFSYNPLYFKQSYTVALRKPCKGDYSALVAWQPVALLKTLEKILETVVASKITDLSKDHVLLPPKHMGACPGGFTDTALDM